MVQGDLKLRDRRGWRRRSSNHFARRICEAAKAGNTSRGVASKHFDIWLRSAAKQRFQNLQVRFVGINRGLEWTWAKDERRMNYTTCKRTEWATLLACDRDPDYREAPPQWSIRNDKVSAFAAIRDSRIATRPSAERPGRELDRHEMVAPGDLRKFREQGRDALTRASKMTKQNERICCYT